MPAPPHFPTDVRAGGRLTLDALKLKAGAETLGSPATNSSASTGATHCPSVQSAASARPATSVSSRCTFSVDEATPTPASSTASQRTVGSADRGACCTRSNTTNALLTDTAEWWVLRPPVEADQVFGTGSGKDEEEALPHLEESWCGVEPDGDRGDRTRWYHRGLLAPVRRHCAGRRHRYVWNGFDLDLSYITSRIIAMGFPGDGTSAAFRNPRTEVARFLSWAHEGHFRIYNLCAEKSHASNGFPDATVHIPCMDHCPPTLEALLEFCSGAMTYLAADPEHVIAVHCKAGKGRTGTMICALLVFAGAVQSAHQALRWYELMRGGKRSGVTIPGQIRWVAMFERWLRCRAEGLIGDPMGVASPHSLRSLRVGPFRDSASTCMGGSKPISLRVALFTRAQFKEHKAGHCFREKIGYSDGDGHIDVSFGNEPGPAWDQNDGIIMIVAKHAGGTTKMKVWWHHAFLRPDGDTLVLQVRKEWIEGLHHDVGGNKLVPGHFNLRAAFVNEPRQVQQQQRQQQSRCLRQSL